ADVQRGAEAADDPLAVPGPADPGRHPGGAARVRGGRGPRPRLAGGAGGAAAAGGSGRLLRAAGAGAHPASLPVARAAAARALAAVLSAAGTARRPGEAPRGVSPSPPERALGASVARGA